MHTCDARDCVRNDDWGTYEVAGQVLLRIGHLVRGTSVLNTLDRAAKGRTNRVPPTPERQARGTRHGRARLTETAVDELRQLRAQGWTRVRLASRFGVSTAAIWSVLNGKTWTHVP